MNRQADASLCSQAAPYLGSDDSKPMKVDCTDYGVLRLALVEELHITSAPSHTPSGSKRTFDRVHKSGEAAPKATLQFCRTLPHVVGTARVHTLYLCKLDFAAIWCSASNGCSALRSKGMYTVCADKVTGMHVDPKYQTVSEGRMR